MARTEGGRPPTLRDVALRAGVSLATASRALSQSGDRVVGEDLNRRVHEAARALGYATEVPASTPRGSAPALGIVVHALTDPYLAMLADSMCRNAHERGLGLSLATTGNHVGDVAGVVSRMEAMRVRALVLVGGRWSVDEPPPELLAAVAHYTDRGGRAVTVSWLIPGIDRVVLDHDDGARQLALHISGQGYRRPLVLAGPRGHADAVARSTAMIDALHAVGITVPETHRIRSDYTRTGGAIGMHAALEAGLDMDVVVGLNDVMALGAMSEARAFGLSLPRDLAFTGFGDLPSLRDTVPELTTVHVPVTDVGRLAVNLALDGPGDGSGLITVPVSLVARDSTPGTGVAR